MRQQDTALAIAIQLLTQQIIKLPQQITENAVRTARGERPDIGDATTQYQPGFVTDTRDKVNNAPAGDVSRNSSAGSNVERRRVVQEAGGAEGALMKAKGAATDKLADAQGMLAARFAMMIGPLQLFAQVLSANTSGFQVLGKATQLFASVLAPVLLPVTMILATAFVAISDVLIKELEPHFEEYADLIINEAVPAIEEFTDALKGLISDLKGYSDWFDETFGENAVGIDDLFIGGDRVDKALGKAPEDAFIGGDRVGKSLGKAPADAAGAEGGGRGERGGGGDSPVRGALRDVITSLRLSMGKPASFSGLESVGRSAQLAALNQDPIEQRMLQVQQKLLATMERVANNTRPKGSRVYDPARPGLGDFGGDEGSGGGFDSGEP